MDGFFSTPSSGSSSGTAGLSAVNVTGNNPLTYNVTTTGQQTPVLAAGNYQVSGNVDVYATTVSDATLATNANAYTVPASDPRVMVVATGQKIALTAVSTSGVVVIQKIG